VKTAIDLAEMGRYKMRMAQGNETRREGLRTEIEERQKRRPTPKQP